MAPSKRKQPASPISSRAKRAYLSNSPQSSSSDLPPTASPSSLQTPEDVRPPGHVRSTRHASPPPELSNTATTRQTRSSESNDNAGAHHPETTGNLPIPNPLLDWLETHARSSAAKQRSIERLPAAGSEYKNTGTVSFAEKLPKARHEDTSRGKAGQDQPTVEDDLEGTSSAGQILE
ncbi:hypothetical protein BU25DRAFT_254599 [Macroventuria anomochaeta]|uniref:Uncharacterized protein n=1 Tax=Macroventuria anomochaeta TaxID=301207 RepID=A0ACB6S897_9PLEO|nr:uncharacterized protein BU25DRAFT_254599 [Macroventuria anomochaeta]KAF2630227.1 hypothetical protein BU25DRAFT_254599 [Macroventuria anomochaeta]